MHLAWNTTHGKHGTFPPNSVSAHSILTGTCMTAWYMTWNQPCWLVGICVDG